MLFNKMVLINIGRNRVRDLIRDNMTKGQSGTGTALVTLSDTGLQIPLVDTLNTLTDKTVSSDSINVTHIVTTGEGNGEDITEWEIRNTSGSSYNRVVKASISKSSTIEINMIHSFEVIN